MNTWVILALLGGFLTGLSNFFSKSVALNNINKYKVMLYASSVYIIFSGIYLFFNHNYFELTILIGLLITVRIIFAIEKNLFIMEGLKYIESSLFFPIHKIIHVVATFIIGMVIFGEFLGTVEYIAVFLGIVVILLLSSKENKKIQLDYKKGITLLFFANLLLLFSSTINKYIATIDFNIFVYMFLSGIIGNVFLLTKKDIYKKSSPEDNKKEIKYGLLKGVFMYFGFSLMIYALKEGPFVLVQMMYGFSTFVPIILSILIYKEVVNFRKIMAFLLFIVVILLLTFNK